MVGTLPLGVSNFNRDSLKENSDKGSVGNDYQTFLKMLTVQIKNQDPLSPMESSDFAVQLATFSGVEQQVKTNELLEKLVGEKHGNLAGLAEWIGKTVRTISPAYFSGRKIDVYMNIPPEARDVHLVAFDGRGREVSRDFIKSTSNDVQWLGETSDGSKLKDGFYSFKFEYLSSDNSLKSEDAENYSKVFGVETSADGERLVHLDGAYSYLNSVRAVFE